MEPLTFFAATVGFVAAAHLITRTAERLGYGRYNRKPVEGKRKDWYCFFRPADLTGEQTGAVSTDQSLISEEQRREQQRKIEANRSRLQV